MNSFAMSYINKLLVKVTPEEWLEILDVCFYRSLDGVTGGDEYELTGDDTEYHSDPITKHTRQVG